MCEMDQFHPFVYTPAHGKSRLLVAKTVVALRRVICTPQGTSATLKSFPRQTCLCATCVTRTCERKILLFSFPLRVPDLVSRSSGKPTNYFPENKSSVRENGQIKPRFSSLFPLPAFFAVASYLSLSDAIYLSIARSSRRAVLDQT